MLNAGDFSLPRSSNSLLSLKTNTNPFARPFSLFPLSASSRQFRRAHLELRAQRNDGSSRVSAPKKKRRSNNKRAGAPMVDLDGLRSFEDELGYEDGEEEDEDGGVLLPLENMKKWLENRPRGFGEGKVYDTVVEDQLLDEMRQSLEAQAANIRKLKEDPASPESKRAELEKKAKELAPDGVKVRVTNLPKKKNVHRDLSAAFKGVPGLISINPAVSGNKKTRDPICKGFGFVYFKSEKDAKRFVEMFSQQSISFGKIQKQIKCEMVDSKPLDTQLVVQSTQVAPLVPRVEVRVVEEDQSTDYDTDDSLVDEFESSIIVEFDDHQDDVDVSEWEDEDEELNGEDCNEDQDSVTEMKLNDSGSFEQSIQFDPKSTERTQEPEKRLRVKDKDAKVPKRNGAAKGKEVKVPKLNIPGSAKRLRVKEKAVLTDVFSKYGKKSALASKKER